MADSAAHLRRKIDSASDLQSVVRAMKAQAAASVGQYEQSLAAVNDYARTVEQGLGACFRSDGRPSVTQVRTPAAMHPPIHAVVFGSDQGLVGRFNDIVADFAGKALSTQVPNAQVWAVGRRVRSSLLDRGIVAQGDFPVPAMVKAITHLVTDVLIAVFDSTSTVAPPDAAFELHLFYNRQTSGSAYAPVSQRLLPLDEAWRLDLARRAWPTALPPELIGDPMATMRGLIREHVFVSIFQASAASLASENASRMAAMDRADRNIDTMLHAMNDRFRSLRQSSIDAELSDVISGFKALNQTGRS